MGSLNIYGKTFLLFSVFRGLLPQLIKGFGIVIQQPVHFNQHLNVLSHFPHALDKVPFAAGIEYGGGFDILGWNIDDFRHRVDDQPDNRFIMIDDDDAGAFVIVPCFHPEAQPDIHDRDNLTAQIGGRGG